MRRRRREAFLLAQLACAVAASAAPPDGGWQLLWADEFNGATLDPIKWNTNYPWGPTHNHEAYMSPDHVTVDRGTLNLTATPGIPAGAPTTSVIGANTYPLKYTSGAVNTSGKLNFTYGYVEARLMMPHTLGMWPAFWTLQHGWPPEIDIQETPLPTTAAMSHYDATYHYGIWQAPHYYSSGSYATGADLTASFHNYGVDWEPDHLTFYFDEHPVYTVTDAAAVAQAANMYLILDLAVGGWPGEPPANANFPATYKADWVRVWQRPSSVTTSTWTHAGSGNWDTDADWNAGAPKLGGMTAVFGTVGASSAKLDWTGSKTIGGLVFQSDTSYVLGSPSESLMLADPSGHSYIDVQSGGGSQSIGSRIEPYNDVSIRNYTIVPFTVASNVIGTGQLSLEFGAINLNGAVTSTGSIAIDNGGRVTLNGSIQTPASDLSIATATPSVGSLTVPAGAIATVRTFRVGSNGGATLSQTGGTISTNQSFVVGESQSASGAFSMTGGTLNVRATRGRWGDLEVAAYDSSSGVVNVSGAASVRLLNNANLLLGSQGTGGNATFNQNGGSVTFYSDDGATVGGTGAMILGRNRSRGTYTYNLNGGTLTAPSITHFSGTGVFAFNGGTLVPSADNISFMQGLSSAVVNSGGAIIDTAGHNVTIAQDLLDGGGGLTKNGDGTLTLAAHNNYSGGTIVNGGSLLTTTAGALPAGQNVINPSTLVIAAGGSVGSISGSGTTAITGGVLEAQSIAQDILRIAPGATLRLGTPLALSTVNSLSIAPGGKLDLSGGEILINNAAGSGSGGAPTSTIRSYLASGYAGGQWNGPGIDTSTADSNHAIAYEATANGLVIRLARIGDTNLDGSVDFADLLRLAQHYGQTNAGWGEGDLNYDGSVGFDDLLAFFQHFGAGAGGPQPLDQVGIVPEPAACAVLCVAGFLPRRRRPAAAFERTSVPRMQWVDSANGRSSV